MNKLTNEQAAAVESRGKVIVSASAGSGKTFVMIQKLVGAICGGADLDEILAVTFTKKAAAQMKEKLRSALIASMEGADADTRARLKVQLSKIASADISTIHSLCARLLRTYFYVLGTDGGFDIISADDSSAKDLKARALDAVFERRYQSGDEDFKLLLSCFMRKRSDASLKKLLDEAYFKVRSCAHYEELLANSLNIYTEEGFAQVCAEYEKMLKSKFNRLISSVEKFAAEFEISKNADVYEQIFNEMLSALKTCAEGGIFGEKPALSVTKKPVARATDSEYDRLASDGFKAFRDETAKKYKSLCGDFSDRQTELENFLQSGRIAKAFCGLIAEFDGEYAEAKREENKLDYNDLEHLTLKLLADESVKNEINSAYKYVFVDEYQDVNPVQEEIISSFVGETFLVGDVKQAIYGFRGSRSQFFAEKFRDFAADGRALKLSNNFRSSDGVLNFVNAVFTDVMTAESCGINYKSDGVMFGGGGYPEGDGSASVLVFGKEEKQEKELKIYSVAEDGRTARHTREGLAVLAAVESELKKQHYDLKQKKYVDTQAGDICILTRKNKGASTEGIVRALRDGGYSVCGERQSNICALPEVKQFLDILSLIDNAEQDIPLVSALLSPLGGMNENELAQVRVTLKDKKELSFRDCCKLYCSVMRGSTADKLKAFGEKLEKLRNLSQIVSAGELADELLETYGLETAYGAGGGEKLKNVLKLIDEGAVLPLPAFLEKIKKGGYDIPAPSSAEADSIKIMTMHAAKGLEFPVVIIADVCRTFRGADYCEMPFDEKYGFAPKRFDRQNMLTYNTVLRRLCKARADAEEIKNEMNLFYVACTRAMNRLYVLAEEAKTPAADLQDAKCYADLFDIEKFFPKRIEPHADVAAFAEDGAEMIYAPDKALAAEIDKRFAAVYKYENSIDLPVKSSASAILRAGSAEEPFYAEHKLFGGEGETGTERGTAYHRFLELCDFSLKSLSLIKEQIDNFAQSGRITAEQAEMLSADELSEILSMPVFDDLQGARLFREREFLCRMRACDILPHVEATDFVLVQGAIDLLACGDFGIKIIDYKYSRKSDEELVASYSAQLNLYKKAAALITGNSEEKISCVIVNIFKRRQINL